MKMRMNQNGAAAYSAPRSTAPSMIGSLFDEAAAMLNLWRSRRSDRRAVRHLDDHMLRDIGLDRMSAEQIGTRPFWKA